MIVAMYSPAPVSGKTTLANFLCKEHGFLKLSFATPLKQMMGAFLDSCGFSKGEINYLLYGDGKDEMFEPFNGKFRIGLQTLGTEWGRGLNRNLWVWAMERKLHIYQERNIVIDDLRFLNEYQMLLGRGATIVHIMRPGVVSTETHESEGALDHEVFHLYHVNEDPIPESTEKLWRDLEPCLRMEKP